MRSQVWRRRDGFVGFFVENSLSFAILLVQLGLVGFSTVSRVNRLSKGWDYG